MAKMVYICSKRLQLTLRPHELSQAQKRNVKVCIIRVVHIFFQNLPPLFDKYAVALTEHDALVKSSTNIFFQILWPSQKTQTLCDFLAKLTIFPQKSKQL